MTGTFLYFFREENLDPKTFLRKKRTLLWILGISGALLVLLFGLLLLAPRLINTETVREKVLAAFSENLGGQVEYKKIGLSFLPRPWAPLLSASHGHGSAESEAHCAGSRLVTGCYRPRN